MRHRLKVASEVLRKSYVVIEELGYSSAWLRENKRYEIMTYRR